MMRTKPTSDEPADNKWIALCRVALRQRAIYIPTRNTLPYPAPTITETVAFVVRLTENGFTVTEELLRALNTLSSLELAMLTELFEDVLGLKLNWMPLVKGWNVPTGERRSDHLAVLFANMLIDAGIASEAGTGKGNLLQIAGTRLPCGHFIPEGTFPIERYNGCPFCGKPFRTADFVYHGQGSSLKELRLWTDVEMQRHFHDLLTSPVPIDATQQESLRTLLWAYHIPTDAEISMKETAMLVIDALVELGREQEASQLLHTPTDILRYLWYKKTGLLQLVRPTTLVERNRKLNSHHHAAADRSAMAAELVRMQLRLKYNRQECRRVAAWLNGIGLSPRSAAEDMNPQRGMWVRMIHALRLGEYSRRKGFEKLAAILDTFYRCNFTTFQGRINRANAEADTATLFALLQQRPGLFARSLFSTMLRHGADASLAAFAEIADALPARLLLSLMNNADLWFDSSWKRVVRTLPGGVHSVEPHPLINSFNQEELQKMADGIKHIFEESMRHRFAAAAPASAEEDTQEATKTIYIDPMLMQTPLAVGDRATTIQDTSCALQGTRFAVEGDDVRLFMEWGKGLPAQHLDMDLSARICYAGETQDCAYYNLTVPGAQHSGDIRSIPDMVGTAEYIELSLPELKRTGAKYVIFTCNAYSRGAVTPNLVVGWMNSAYEMKLSEETGVAYDPSCVQHQVRISTENLSKGLVFGVLDIAEHEIYWLEMPFQSQGLYGLDDEQIAIYLRRLKAKTSVGKLLSIKAEAQGLTEVSSPDAATESYTYEWALDPAAVSQLLAL